MMRKFMLTGVVSAIILLASSPVLAEEMRLSGEEFAKSQMQIEMRSIKIAPERKGHLQPLSDDELSQITAAGIPPLVYMVPSYIHYPMLIQPLVAEKTVSIGGTFISSSFKGSFSSILLPVQGP